MNQVMHSKKGIEKEALNGTMKPFEFLEFVEDTVPRWWIFGEKKISKGVYQCPKCGSKLLKEAE